MCMLLVYLEPDAGPEEYRLVLANIRDEIYSRPASVAHFWKDSPAIIGGQDLQPGREGGTWLAMNAHNGKISALLNVLQPAADLEANKKGRGFLVVDYVKGTQSAMEYLETLSDTAHDYNGFLQFALDLSDNKVDAAYFSNMANQPPKTLPHGVHTFGNSLDPLHPWPKVQASKEKFQNILDNLGPTVAHKTDLEEQLFHLLSDPTRYPIDEQMMKQGCDLGDNFLQRLSAMRVNIPSSNYGSRTHTLILVDGNNNVDYVVKDMVDPSPTQTEWKTYRYHFTLPKP